MHASEIARSLLAGLFLALVASAGSPSRPAGTITTRFDAEPRPSSSSQSVGEAELEAFLGALQKAIASDDRRKVVSMIHYPIVVWVRDRNVLFKTPASLLPSYEMIFTPRLKKIIAEAQAKSLFRNWQGAMIHDGKVWINEVGARLKIITINAGEQRKNDAKAAQPSTPVFKVHPRVFSLIDCWESDSECPVVTEVNLDAVEQNSNQFSGEVKQDGAAYRSTTEDGRGFMSYEVLTKVGNRYTVIYSENGGGTMTTSSIIEFIVERRQLSKDGKLKSIRVLRVLGFRHM